MKTPEPPPLPELAREKWLEKWWSGEVDTKLEASIAKLPSLAASAEVTERAPALACLVALGDHVESFKQLSLLASEQSEFDRYLQATLPWLPFEQRTSVFKELAATAESEADIASLLAQYAKVRNPAGAEALCVDRRSAGQ